MLRAARARRIAAATAFGGGGLTLVGGGTLALLYLQARLARRAVGVTEWARPPVDGIHGHGSGPPIRMLMMGDSTAAGFAVETAARTPGVMLATGLANAADRPVRLRCTAFPGATSATLAGQIERSGALAEATRYDVAVIFIGANDVIRRVRPSDAVSHLREACRSLVDHGTAVVVATCPDLGTVRPIGWPLRSVARRASRQLAAAQTIAVTEVGGRTVSLSDLLVDVFRDDPSLMFGPDRFHPSAHGYAQAASALLPSVCAALGLLPEFDTLPAGGILPVDRAAVVAAENPGTEVSRAGDPTRGRRGRWAALVRRPLWPPREPSGDRQEPVSADTGGSDEGASTEFRDR
ncbi:SGNH/GDSL hydrolase family protein [Nocardiopsis sp. N85]|uniref:SGNH/GDSL hydrolase family protein n=1 Tax=Nocardiopsis sp. N85 TaxID=3029400 RepID=UPI00237F9A4D|nr:SGNH/GDSL hydrolase family protein [Nocardiopsis sp. N85]MDE3721758.1 SGNH/GDSL hydrolase family protein [Nocardiopsis sp. N85]